MAMSPSVSSVSPGWDQSNERVIELLADWCRDAGFVVEVLDVASGPSSPLRKLLHAMDEIAAMEFLLDKLKATKSNSQFFESMKR